MTPNIRKSQAFLALAMRILKGKIIDANDLKNTSFEGNQPDLIEPHLLRMELYRAAIATNPNAYIAMTNLAICISQGGPLEEDDLQYTRFKDTPLSDVEPNEVVADFYRNAIKINPAHTMAICNLVTCFQRGAIPLQTDFIGTRFEKKRIKNIPIDQLIVALYRKARRWNPEDPIANYMIATAIFNGATFEEEDLDHTDLKNEPIEDINRFVLVAEILRNFIEINSNNSHSIYNEALSMLAFCLSNAPPETQYTTWNDDSAQEITPLTVAIGLSSTRIALVPSHDAIFQKQRRYVPQYNSVATQNTKETLADLNVETLSKKSPRQ